MENSGAEVIGPFADVKSASRNLRQGSPDCAVLDVNLGESASFDPVRALRMRGTPFLFFTGYDASALPPEFADVERLEKPVKPARLLEAVERCCRSAGTST